MRVNIHIETDSIEEGRRFLRGLDALLSSGAATVAYGPPIPMTLAQTLATPVQPQQAAAEPAPAPAPAAEAPAAEAPKPRRSRKAEAAPAPEPEVGTAAADAPVPTATDPAEEPKPELSVDFLRQRVTHLSGLVGVPAAMAVVKRSGHDKIASIPESKWESFHTLLEGEIAKAEQARTAA